MWGGTKLCNASFRPTLIASTRQLSVSGFGPHSVVASGVFTQSLFVRCPSLTFTSDTVHLTPVLVLRPPVHTQIPPIQSWSQPQRRRTFTCRARSSKRNVRAASSSNVASSTSTNTAPARRLSKKSVTRARFAASHFVRMCVGVVCCSGFGYFRSRFVRTRARVCASCWLYRCHESATVDGFRKMRASVHFIWPLSVRLWS